MLVGGSGAMPWASGTRVASDAASSSASLSVSGPARAVRSSSEVVAAGASPGIGERVAVWWHGASALERVAVGASVAVVVWGLWRAMR